MEKIVLSLKNWREERNIVNFGLDIQDNILDEIEEAKEELLNGRIQAFAVEVADVAIFCFNGIGQLGMDYVEHKHGYERISLEALESLCDSMNISLPVATYQKLAMLISLCKDLIESHGYDFKKIVMEKIKVVSSRVQDPSQKLEWEENGVRGKWLKDKNQDKSTIYIADYDSCKL